MRDRLKHWTAVTALVLVAGGSLVGCSDEGGTGGGVGSDAGTELTQKNFFTEVTQAQAEAGSSHVTMDMKAGGQSIEAEGDVTIGDTPADTAMAMKMTSGEQGLGSLEMRLVDNVFYLNFGPMTQNKFAKIDLKDKNNPLGRQYGDLLDSIDPAKQLQQFEGAITGFEQKGESIELDGVEAQPYVVDVDPAKIKQMKGIGGNLPKKLTYTLFIGPDNLPRRLVSELPDVAGTGPTTLTMDYSKWGQDVTIEAPKASEISDKDFLSELGNAPKPS